MATHLRKLNSLGSFCASALCVMALASALPSLASAADPAPPAASDSNPLSSLTLSTLDAAYADLKFLFDLVGDPRGYRDLYDTIDLALDGISRNRAFEISTAATTEGLRTVGYLPAESNADFKKFLQALEDSDVRTSSSIPAARRNELKGVKLQPNERIMVSMYEGFVRFDSGYVRLGGDLEAVRRPHAVAPADNRTATISMRIDGSAATPATRHASFEKSRDKILSKLTKEAEQTEAAFALERSMFDGLLSAVELAFAESSSLALDWRMPHDQKQAQIEMKMSPAAGTSLAGNVDRMGTQPDAFGGVSTQGVCLSGAWNLPVNPALGRSLKAIAASARVVAKERINSSSKLAEADKSADVQSSDLAFDVLEDLASVQDHNGFVRVWANENQSLTTIGAVRLPDAQKYRSRVQSLPKQEEVGPKPANGEVETHKFAVSRWRSDYQELFDNQGSVYVAIGEDVIWLGIGENALGRLQQCLKEAAADQASPSRPAVDFSAEMRPLAEAWDRIYSRRAKPAKANGKPKSTPKDRGKKITEEKASISLLKEVTADLNLPKIAAQAYRGGKDHIAVLLKREQDGVSMSATFDEGTLRFAGQALSKFVKDNF